MQFWSWSCLIISKVLKVGLVGLSAEMLKDVDWHVDEIHLKNCDLSQLPNSPTSPTLVKLFLQVPGLTVIPPTFFDCMPVLKVLDLSNTSILSLPSSISSLSLLQEFFLRDCSALMELPTQIGMLTKLKLFDIEGTEIMYIPKEIGNLNDLECLRVSLSPYADYYIKTKSIEDAIIPRMMISKLKKLKELCISVNPEAEWWEHEVEAIQHELCHLEALQTLKWYLPTNKVLQQFLRLERDRIPIYAYLSSFMLTIGQHAQLTSCLPRGLETKFEKFKKCLKCINGEGSMHEISIILGNAEALFLSRHWTIVKLSAFNIRKLKYCLLVECNQMQTLVDADESSEDGETGMVDGEKVELASLQYLGIHYMKKLQSIWKGPIDKDSLSSLRILALHTCPELTTIFTPSVAENLLSLIELTVEDCPKVKSLISTESPNFKSGPLFPRLKKILLLDLPELVSIFDDLIILPKLDSMLIYNCLKLRCLSTTGLPHIKEIKGECEWWNALNCDKSKWINIFVQLKEKRDLVEQLDEATSSLQHFHDIVKISQWPEGKGKKSFDLSDSQAPAIEADTSYASIETTGDTSYASTEKDEGLFLSRQEAVRRLRIQTDGKEDGTAVAGSMAYPHRPGEADCIFYLRTGMCGYGNRCRFNHPTPIGQVNQHGGELPERVGKPDCVYFLRTGTCKFGISCKYNHPRDRRGAGPIGLNMVGLPMRQGSLSPVTSTSIFGGLGSIEQAYPLSSVSNLPERPGEPECRYFMNTGNCKYGSDCKYHHPKEKIAQLATSLLGPLGLPLRPGQAVCSYYSMYGICKFGPTCKFDHPLVGYSYNYGMSLPSVPILDPSVFPYGGRNSPTLHSSVSSPSKSSKNAGAKTPGGLRSPSPSPEHAASPSHSEPV